MKTENNTKKKVLIFSTAYLPFVGGAEVAVKEITDRLGDDFEFDLITAQLDKSLPKKERIGQVMVYRIGIGKPLLDKFFIPYFAAVKAWKLNKIQEYFCFWGMMATYPVGGAYIVNIIRRLLGRKKIPMILTLQEGDSEAHLKFKWFGLITLSWKLALRQTDILTGISNFLLHRAEKKGYKGKSVLIPNGVDVSLFTKDIAEYDKEKLKQELGKKGNDIFLVTVSRLSHKNAVDDIISALKILPEHISLIIIGKGKEGSNLQKQAEELGVEARVKFVGFIPYEKLPEYLSVCDIFIRPSRSEGFGNSFIEAMAAGVPVIATPVGGIPDFLDDKETGIFCSPDNPKSIAEAVNLILSDSSLKQKIIYQAKERVTEGYNWQSLAQKMKIEIFDRIV